MEGPGTMSWEEFLENADSLVRVSNEISDGWELRGEKSIPGQAYLYRRVKSFVPANYLADDASLGIDHEAAEDGEEEAEDANDIPRLAISDPYEAIYETEQPFVTEHHILWHMSYGVPVMFFNAWFSDFPGANRVTVTKAQQASPKDTLGYGELSQAIHPILGTTFLHLHPCRSQELLSKMWRSIEQVHLHSVIFFSNNKLVSWLSVVSPAALNLRLSTRYCDLTRIEQTKRTSLRPDDEDD